MGEGLPRLALAPDFLGLMDLSFSFVHEWAQICGRTSDRSIVRKINELGSVHNGLRYGCPTMSMIWAPLSAL